MTQQAQKTMSIYMAGPIEGVTREDALNWREEIAAGAPAGCLLFNPVTAWHGVSTVTAGAVAFGDRVAIVNCDGVLANLSGPGRAFGTIREIEFARAHGKPVAIATGKVPIDSCFAHDVFQAETVDQAFNLLIEAIRDQQDQPHMHGILLRLPGFTGFDPQDGDE